jgi:competence protein ComEC
MSAGSSSFLVMGALSVVVGVALAPFVPLGVPPLALLVLCGLVALRLHVVALVPTGLVLGGLIASSIPRGPVLRGPSTLEGVVAAAPTGRVADVAVWRCGAPGKGRPCRGRVRVVFESPPAPGSQWVVFGTGLAPSDPGPRGGPSRMRSADLAGVQTVLIAKRARRLGAPVVERPIRAGPVAVLDAVAAGDRRGVDDAVWDVLRDTGTSHLLAISGFHVGVVAGTVGGLVTLVLRRFGVLFRGGVPTVGAWWAGALAAGSYAWAAGAPISAQRAAGVVVLAAVGRSFGRTIDPWRLLALAAVGVCIVDPAAIASPGFQLSFGAVAGLLRFSPLLDGWIRRWPRGLQWVGSGASATFTATLGTLPAAAWWFQSLSLTSPIANIVAVPYMALVVVPCAAASVWAPEPIAGWGTWAGGHAVTAMLAGLSWLRMAPLAPAVGPFGALLLCAVFLRARVGWIAAVCVVVLGLRPRSADGLEVTFFDVGQGDAALVEHADGTRWLVDAGRSDRIVPALRRRGVRHLHRVVATHADDDHAGGLAAVLTALRVDALWLPRLDGFSELISVAVANGVDVHLEPSPLDAVPGLQASDNDASLVVWAESPWGRVGLLGDIEALGEQHLAVPEGPGPTVIKVPHHGSETSSTPAMLDRVQPDLAVLSVGHNYYGHPHDAVLDRYAQRGIPVWRTDVSGNVTVRLDANGMTVWGEFER